MHLTIVLSDAFAHPLRKAAAHPTPIHQKLQRMRPVTVKLAGRIGVLGAQVRLAYETVRFPDGRTGAWPVDLTSGRRLTVPADHDALVAE